MSSLKKEVVHLLGNYGHIGITFVACIVIGMAGGWWLDTKVFADKYSPLFIFIGLAFGIAAAFKSLFDILWKVKKSENKDDERG